MNVQRKIPLMNLYSKTWRSETNEMSLYNIE